MTGGLSHILDENVEALRNISSRKNSLGMLPLSPILSEAGAIRREETMADYALCYPDYFAVSKSHLFILTLLIFFSLSFVCIDCSLLLELLSNCTF